MRRNPQSSWTYDLLWTKARLYMERALDAPRDEDLFPFWSSLALEFLARATLAHISPVLLAEGSDSDGRNILHALGFEPKIKNFIPKSISVSDVLTRCEQIVDGFTKDMELFCKGLANKRNDELHSGGSPFSTLPNHSWLPRFYEASEALLRFQSKSLAEFVGPEEASAASKMLAAIADETATSVKRRISAHAQVWSAKAASEQTRLASVAEQDAKPWKGHVVDCPACGCKALLHGEEIRQQPPKLEDEELVVRSLMLPTSLICTGCGLTIEGHNQLFGAGLGGQYTNRITYDPVDYYAEEAPRQEEPPSWMEYNNE